MGSCEMVGASTDSLTVAARKESFVAEGDHWIRASTLHLLARSIQYGSHRRREPVPALGFHAQPFTPSRRELVELGAPVVVRRPPLALEQTLVLQTEQSGIQRALLDVERASGDLLDAQQHAIAMTRPERNGLQDQQV